MHTPRWLALYRRAGRISNIFHVDFSWRMKVPDNAAIERAVAMPY
jgi:hypothetical protein